MLRFSFNILLMICLFLSLLYLVLSHSLFLKNYFKKGFLSIFLKVLKMLFLLWEDVLNAVAFYDEENTVTG